MYCRKLPIACIAGMLTLALSANAARAADDLPALDQALRDNAPKIVKKLRERNCKNVGVLKFMVRTGDGPARDNVGPLNTSLADRLEVALVLALDDDSLGIIAHAGKGVVDSNNQRATHLTEAGRKELFEINKKYFHIPWKVGEGVKPDAFLTGEARLSPDRRSMRIAVQLFVIGDPETVCTICEFSAATDLRTLTETGITFSTRGFGDDPAKLVAKATEGAPQSTDNHDDLLKKAAHALADLDKSPIKLEILYDKQPQRVEMSPVDSDKTYNVLLRVPTPKDRHKVSFRLSPTDRDTYGVVLKINGQNSIERQQQDALDCRKWILQAGDAPITVRGYQLNDTDMDEFKVQSKFESELNSVYYGENAGTINLVVYRAGKAEDAIVKNDDPVATISRGMLSLHGEPMATDRKRFQEQLRKETGTDAREARSRGLVTGSGNIGNSPVKRVDFHPDPIPVLSVTIRYFDPGQK
jgi:hypothetical protein